ncbi:hypothetical protein [Xanthobacter versatilis]|uniref:hypothetical protein n=1 Tax=Xanthobacter autotrophicus (strain ATCC BAA-1158 / Py2) TaxID=78245 RepID=UPI003726C96E
MNTTYKIDDVAQVFNAAISDYLKQDGSSLEEARPAIVKGLVQAGMLDDEAVFGFILDTLDSVAETPTVLRTVLAKKQGIAERANMMNDFAAVLDACAEDLSDLAALLRNYTAAGEHA